MKEKADLVIACMDRRMNQHLEEMPDGNNTKTIMLRNAGADVNNLSSSINEALSSYDVMSIKVIVHNNCAAMNAISKIKEGEKPQYEQAEKTSRKYSQKSWDKLCEENLSVQEKSLKALLGPEAVHIKTSAESFDVSTAPLSSGEKRAAVIIESEGRFHKNYSGLAKGIGSESIDVYFIQYIKSDNIMPDISLVVRSGVRDISILSAAEGMPAAASLLRDMSRQPFASKAHIKLNEIEYRKPKIRI